MRIDDATLGWSGRLTAASWQTYRNAFNNNFAKRPVNNWDYLLENSSKSVALNVSPSPTKGSVQIIYEAALQGTVQITAYDTKGSAMIIPGSNSNANSGQLPFVFSQGGVYFIVLSIDGNPIKAVKIIVED